LKKALMVFRFDNAVKATGVLKEEGIRVVGQKDLGTI
jgi:hypothetical protein